MDAMLPKPMRMRSASKLSFLIATLLGFLIGCAGLPTTPPYAGDFRPRAIVILPARHTPETDMSSYAIGAGAGAARGAAEGAGASAGIAALAATTHPLFLVGFPQVTVALMTVLVPLGALGGSQAAMSPAMAERVTSTISEAVSRAKLHEDLSNYVLDAAAMRPEVLPQQPLGLPPGKSGAGQDYTPLKTRGIDATLEVGITAVRIKTDGPKDLKMQMILEASARMVRIADNRKLKAESYRYTSPLYPIRTWIASKGSRINQEFDHGLRYLAESILTGFVDHTYWPYPPKIIGGEYFDVCGLVPQSPEHQTRAPQTKYSFINDLLGTPRIVIQEGKVVPSLVDSLQPEFRWESFPRESDARHRDAITDVTYELRIWRTEQGRSGPVIYERVLIPDSSHRIEASLRPLTTYFWSVRARYSLDGAQFVTPWSHSRHKIGLGNVPCASGPIPDKRYLRFTTPRR